MKRSMFTVKDDFEPIPTDFRAPHEREVVIFIDPLTALLAFQRAIEAGDPRWVIV